MSSSTNQSSYSTTECISESAITFECNYLFDSCDEECQYGSSLSHHQNSIPYVASILSLDALTNLSIQHTSRNSYEDLSILSDITDHLNQLLRKAS